jgi:hypothetical protein
VVVSLATGSGTTAHPLAIRGDDLYETPPVAVHELLAVEKLPKVIWEPACGPGSIVRELEAAGHTVISSDLVDYGWGHDTRRDFLMELAAPHGVEAIVTNPPFKLAEEFAEHAKDKAPVVCLLLRLAFLEGLRWKRGLGLGLANVWVFAPRLPFMHRAGYAGPKHSNSGMPFAWFVWRDGHTAPPAVGWLNWKDR